MKKPAFIALAALFISSCGVIPAATFPDCRQTIDLPHATVQVGYTQSRIALKSNVASAKFQWSGEVGGQKVLGSDNVYQYHTPDVVNLGCQHDFFITEVEYETY